MVRKVTSEKVKEWHEALRRYEEKPNPKNRRLLAEAKEAYEQEKQEKLLQANNEMQDKLEQRQKEKEELEASRAQAKTRLERVRDLISRMNEEVEEARKLNRRLRAAVKENVEQKRGYNNALKELRALKKKLLKERDS